MEGPAASPERARKRGRLSQDLGQATVAEAAQKSSLPLSRAPPQVPFPRLTAARGGSPTGIDRNLTFSHPTLPGLQNFGNLAVASPQGPLESSLTSCQRAPGGATLQAEETRAVPSNLLYHELEKVDNLSEILETDFSSNCAFSFPDAFSTDDCLWEEALQGSIVNTCCASECTAKTYPSCISCEESCYRPCENPEECSSELCREQSCVCSPPLNDTGYDTPIFDHCEWIGNGENCSATVYSARQTVQHVNENHIKPQTQVTCEWDDCGISTDVDRLPNHLWRDHEPANYVCLWQHCEQAFSTHEELDAHFKMVHCNMGCHWAGCEMITTSQTELQDHFSQQHLQFNLDDEYNALTDHESPPSPGERLASNGSETSIGMQASSVEGKSTCVSTVTSHSNAIDTCQPEMAGLKSCKWVIGHGHDTQCGMILNDGNDLQEHIRSAHIVNLKSTELNCGWIGCEYKQATRDKSKLARHAYTHSKYCFGACKFCKQEFSEKSKLQQHEATHLHEKPHLCKECNCRFPSQNALTNHERIHKGEKPLVCGMMVNGQKCEYACSDPSNMSTHKKKHRPPEFTCSICKKAFCRNDALKRHIRVHEPKKSAIAKKRGLAELGEVGDFLQEI